MKLEYLAFLALVLAAVPCALFLLNLLVYRPLRGGSRLHPPESGPQGSDLTSYDTAANAVSVLIPARNEERNLPATLESLLRNRGCNFEVVVLDDHSTDRTAGMVGEFAARDSRVRLESAPPLPAGWCCKQHACYILARLDKHRLLVFMDADVRLAPDALTRMAVFMHQHKVALASGVPRQQLGTFSERLLLPLIHFVLLGFLPMHAMRRTRSPAISAGCGQLFIARRDAYEACGGHAGLPDSLHDGIQLPRVFRRSGFATALFDATDLATCRMYHTNAETWRGLSKNATEGLAAPTVIGPMTFLLVGGQVLPFVLLSCVAVLPPLAEYCAAVAAVLAYAPQFIAVWRFRQPWGSTLLHPFRVLALVGIQWYALVRHLLGKPAEWKGRHYTSAPRLAPAKPS